MIRSFRHKGLQLLFEQDDGRKLKADQLHRLRLILSALNAAEQAEDMNQPTFRLHPLKGIVMALGLSPFARTGGSPFGSVKGMRTI
ncbi:MAG: type II toxin-antitoxin system RelE/ParE family toxin [Nitrospira sp.]|nr:type II toxin-antitoxin system RelE/ParE family toxin [Nitrospira sp.]